MAAISAPRTEDIYLSKSEAEAISLTKSPLDVQEKEPKKKVFGGPAPVPQQGRQTWQFAKSLCFLDLNCRMRDFAFSVAG